MERRQSHPARVNRDGDFGERFWYWRGASGQAYIHSIYAVDACPPLPGAVYVALRREYSGARKVCSVGRFDAVWNTIWCGLPAEMVAEERIDEIHVHLLAEDEAAARAIAADLAAALAPDRPCAAIEEPVLLSTRGG